MNVENNFEYNNELFDFHVVAMHLRRNPLLILVTLFTDFEVFPRDFLVKLRETFIISVFYKNVFAPVEKKKNFTDCLGSAQ